VEVTDITGVPKGERAPRQRLTSRNASPTTQAGRGGGVASLAAVTHNLETPHKLPPILISAGVAGRAPIPTPTLFGGLHLR